MRARLNELASSWPAAVGGAVAVALSILLRSVWGTKLLAEVVVDATTDALQPRGFSFFLSVFDAAGKPLLFLTILLGEVLLFIAVWRVATVLGSRHRAIESAIVAGAIMLFASALLILVTASGLGSRTSWGEYIGVTALCCGVFAALAAMLQQLDDAAHSDDENAPFAARRAIVGRVPALVLGGLALFVIGRSVSNSTGGGAKTSHSGQVTPGVTETSQFYVVSKNFIDPEVSAKGWRLKAGGLSAKQLSLSLDDVRGMASVEQYTTMQCISNEINGNLMSNALWRGIPMSAFLDRLQPMPDARWVSFKSDDDYVESIDITFAMQDGVMLAYEMNGEPLTDKHGFPLRLLSPGKYGMKHPKWIREIMLTPDETIGYWKERGWDAERMNTSSRIDVPGTHYTINDPALTVQGLAFSGRRGISRVEVSTDDGATWRDATLESPLGPYTWVFWSFDWTDVPATGQTDVYARAYDGTGELQTDVEEPPYPSGATGYPTIFLKFNRGA